MSDPQLENLQANLGSSTDLSPAEAAAQQRALEESALRDAFYRNRPHDQSVIEETKPEEPEISSSMSEETGDLSIETSGSTELDPFIDLITNVQPFLFPAFLAVSGFIVRTIVTKKKTSLVEFSLDCLAAMIIGALVGVAIEDMDLSQNIKYAMIAVAGMVGPDLAGGIIILGQAFKESPTEFIIKHYNAFKGNKPEEGKEKAMTYEEWNQANKDFIDKTFG